MQNPKGKRGFITLGELEKSLVLLEHGVNENISKCLHSVCRVPGVVLRAFQALSHEVLTTALGIQYRQSYVMGERHREGKQVAQCFMGRVFEPRRSPSLPSVTSMQRKGPKDHPAQRLDVPLFKASKFASL